jgi:hypothetical protein
MERLIKTSIYFYPTVFCQLPTTKFVAINDKIVLGRIHKYLTELTQVLIHFADFKKLNDVTDLQFISYLLTQPQQFWGCIERF